jgi:hypothetical protein
MAAQPPPQRPDKPTDPKAKPRLPIFDEGKGPPPQAPARSGSGRLPIFDTPNPPASQPTRGGSGRLPVMDDAPQQSARPVSGKLQLEDVENVKPPPPSGSADAGTPVNKASRAVNPRKQYPMHFDLLMRDLYERKEVPEQWQVVAADEVRLDERNWDVEFTLTDSKSSVVVRRRVEIQDGKLSKITER